MLAFSYLHLEVNHHIPVGDQNYSHGFALTVRDSSESEEACGIVNVESFPNIFLLSPFYKSAFSPTFSCSADYLLSISLRKLK